MQRPDAADLAAARAVLERLGVTPEDLLDAQQAPCEHVPTFAEFVPVVATAVSDGTRRLYGIYWARVVTLWGTRTLDEPTATEIAALVESTKSRAVVRRNSRGGRSAGEHMVAALRCLYKFAAADDHIALARNPALLVPKPRRIPSTRRGLQNVRVEEVAEVASTTGNDPALDALLVRLHLETACRTGAALALRPCDIDEEQCLILLQEKGGVFRWQPASPTLIAHLIDHGLVRGSADPRGPLLRYRDGRPLSKRRYDGLWARVRRQHEWAARQLVSTHWLRHTTLTFVERRFGLAVAQAYAGHSPANNSATTTTTYIRANEIEVATALAALTGEPHPLAIAA
nr:site-specific integrase [Lentzea aerocolonigenes]